MRRGLALVVTLLCALGAAQFLWPQPGITEQSGSTVRQLTFVRQEIDSHADSAAQQHFPEGYFFTNVLYGLAWVQAAHTDQGLRDQALHEARWALARAESAEGKGVFDPTLRPAYGVFWAGWTTWLRGAILTLDNTDGAERQLFAARSDEIAQAFSVSASPFLSAYPGRSWPVDSTVAIAALRLHDHILGDRFSAVIDRWRSAALGHLDPTTGLLPHEVSASDAAIIEGARATSQTVIQRFLPEIDGSFARGQYGAYRRQFISYPYGFGPALREHRQGVDGRGDVDSGPLIAGISLSATVVAMGAARVNGDAELAAAIGAEGELAGVPITLPKTKRYAFGAVPIGDAFVVWSSTARLLTAEPAAASYPLPWWWRTSWLLALGAVATLPWLPAGIRRIRRG
ncbi:hypothetical protein [Mycobacteroides franklinii]|uniref:DUF2264 domain-containing protein n=1 Tax=Mycobacteroides franklinii TaxID=948102 RepID=A0A4R5P5D2_9MYCO|nr:hypothetical protein [Mycobacteroides franklinii]TDH18606.1 hypothetical protein EJ571_18475 [Mycobacteroides franklinii]